MKVLREVALMPLTETRWRRQAPAAQVAPFPGAMPAEGGPPILIGVLAPVWETPDGGRVDVFSECKTYLSLLKGLLAACEQATPAGRTSP